MKRSWNAGDLVSWLGVEKYNISSSVVIVERSHFIHSSLWWRKREWESERERSNKGQKFLVSNCLGQSGEDELFFYLGLTTSNNVVVSAPTLHTLKWWPLERQGRRAQAWMLLHSDHCHWSLCICFMVKAKLSWRVLKSCD